MSNPAKLYRVKIVKQVYLNVAVTAPNAEKALEAVQEQCPSYVRETYYPDGFKDDTAPKATNPIEVTHPTGYEDVHIVWKEKK
jgi:hypothetical protein